MGTDWGDLELLCMRALFGWAMLRGFPGVLRRGELTHPAGWARWGGQRLLANPVLPGVTRFLFEIALVAYVAGLGEPVALGALLAIWAIAVTANSSHGAVNHGHYLTGVILAAQLGGWVAHAVAGAGTGPVVLDTAPKTAVWWTVQGVAATYAASGIAKVIDSGFGWIARSPSLVLYAAANLGTRPRAGAGRPRALRLIDAAGRHPGMARIVFGAGLVLEILAPLSLFNRWTLVAGGVVLWIFHRANQEFLGLAFGQYRMILVIYFINIPYLLGLPFGGI